ncbi:glucose-1-phosphate thymidylyltransferase [Streptomyces griseochromogenes]|uniref:Glucose-1-phosphate thymidylyltransferase n=2 Tax=Streptomyces griseochromogenes TaxID=68214 RepID=A0A1B1BB97_9ACTN|nr:glucose-1-phosphate thymidylyltransferase [Streptomyces griseochromogenes]ANP56002.1 glucose-1-phosphate thymidylyltransferase [Streptomyces griseochromogenes]
MKALVLSGGKGTRLRPFTHSMPKQLVPVANKPVLVHCLENIRDIGVTEVGLIVGDRRDQIEAAVGDGSGLGLRITYIEQDAPRGLAHTVAIARDFLGDDDFVMYLGDNVVVGGVAEAAADFRAHRPAASGMVVKVADPSAFGVAEVGPDGRVERLVEKPKEPRSDLILIGVYFFTPAIHQAVAAIEPSTRGELEITDAIQWLVDSGADVRARDYGCYWKDTGRVEDILECNRELLDGLTHEIAGEVDAASVISGPVVVEAGARVVDSRVTGPAVIGAGTVLRGCAVRPYTAIGRDCVLTGTDIGDSIVLEGASIDQVAGIQGSLVGRQARIRSLEDQERHRLIVGDDTLVEVAA